MNLAVSNFAWNYEDSKEMFSFLNQNNIKNIELVLTKYKNWNELDFDTIIKYKKELLSYDIIPYAIQSLFYNIPYTFENTDYIINHFKRLIDYAEILNVRVLVFGSPNLRKKIDGYQDYLKKIFHSVDDYLIGKSIKIVIEPNTSIYNGEYFINLSEIVEFIHLNKFNSIRTMIDTHNIILESLNPSIECEKYFEYIEHIHISEYKLELIKDYSFHSKFSDKLKELNYDKVITYEVNKSENLLESIKLFSEIYKNK